MGDAAQNVRGEASHVSFDADGFTIIRGVSFIEPTSVLVEYIAFGGTDLSVRVDTVDLNNSQDASVDETAPGFEPDVVFTSFIGHLLDATNDGDNDDSSFSFGWAVNPALQSTDNQFSMMVATRDNQGTSQTTTRFDDAYAGTSFRDGSIDASYEINTFDASGFSVTTRLATATTDEVMGYMALQFGSSPLVFSGQRTSQISTGDDIVTDPRFKPELLIGIGGAVATVADTNTSGNSLAIGITDGTDTYAISY
ncbi:MAG: hypothetical protein K8I00_07995, partial [Candidatus Omnitrophica bacterium]|nr:hypothetical protein [Candidatus Omnitrophota bacterium]